ncbi:hypothetical protein Goari_016823 [Gossypium aridum]|uniref:Uncharacterized protein n=1 Tax=Gossypium aridum TaxID=34290 RepID=A0A7J8WKX8_GOSAI|nr:hypothetical protein [Gossypium aridum]
MNTTAAIVSKKTMKRCSKDNNSPLIFPLLLASLLLSTGKSGCVLVEARIPHFSVIQGSLKSDIYRRRLRPFPPIGMNSPDPNGSHGQTPKS